MSTTTNWEAVYRFAAVAIAICIGVVGCRSKPEAVFETGEYLPFSTQIEYPDPCVKTVSAVTEPLPPHTLREPTPDEMWLLNLEEVVQIALENSVVMRELGVRVISSPQSMTTVYDTALQQTDPRTGEEAALSDFDAQFVTSMFLNQDDRLANPLFVTAAPTSEFDDFQAAITKTSATGTRLSMRNQTSRSSIRSRDFLIPSYYETTFEAEFRHPLLQGGGIEFNRIAGPNGGPGNYNGIMIARIRTDVALADFERSVRDLVEDVQQTYWLLYFSYRNLDARVAARDAALESWRTAKTQLDAGAGDILDESLAREQYYQFQVLVGNALSGVGTDTSTSQIGVGVYSVERRLRLLMGIPVNDGRLIRPSEEPLRAEIVFDWSESVQRSMVRRVELRRQQWDIAQSEFELVAARNLLMTRLDLVGQYRWRGVGDELLGNRSVENGSAFRDLYQGDLQGWQLGLQLTTPIGNRIGHTAVRNAELQLSRSRALLREQERYVRGELSDAFGELDRSYTQTRNNYNRTLAAHQRLDAERTRFDVGDGVLQFVLDAQSRVADAEAQFFQSLVDYNLAVAKVHYSQGTLLDYLGVQLSEGPWNAAAHRSAAKNATRFKTRHLNYCITTPRDVTDGPYQQSVLPYIPRPVAGEPTPAPTGNDGETTSGDEPLPEPVEMTPPTEAPYPKSVGNLRNHGGNQPMRLAAPTPNLSPDLP